jgi:hypothetical protein
MHERKNMSTDTKTDRAALLRAATLVRAAISTQGYIPALMHIAFDGEWATAFNQRMAIAVRCPADIKRMIPGVLLMQGLNAFGGKEVLLHQAEDDSFVMKSGRSKVTLPTLPLSAFPFKWPPQNGASAVDITEDMVSAIKRCLISVNKDANQPAQMGVTFDVTEDGRAVFFSTDNGSISRCECRDELRLPGDAPIIMPLAFCEQLIALSDAFPDCPPYMLIGSGWLEVQFALEGDGIDHVRACLFTSVPVDLDPLDLPKMIRRHAGDVATVTKRTTIIPEAFEPALQRALLVLGNDTHKRVTATVDGGTLRLQARSDWGDTDDSLQLDIDDAGPVSMEAGLVMRGLKLAKRIGINDTVTVLVGGDRNEFVHVVAHVREAK